MFDESISIMECCPPLENLEHEFLTPSADAPELHDFEAFDGFTVWLWVSPIKNKAAHSIPPDSVPVLIEAYWFLTVAGVHQDFGLFRSHGPTVFFYGRLHIDQARKYCGA